MNTTIPKVKSDENDRLCIIIKITHGIVAVALVMLLINTQLLASYFFTLHKSCYYCTRYMYT